MSQKGQLPEQFLNTKIPWGPIGENVYKRTYSQRRADGRKEVFPETVVRAVDGNLGLVDQAYIEADERDKLIGLLLSFAALPAGRHLNASGMTGRQYLFNCHGAGWDAKKPEDHFSFTFDELMMGGGVGSNYSNRYMDTLPTVRHSIDLHIICREDHPDHHEFFHLLSQRPGTPKAFQVSDSREGWVETIDTALKVAFDPKNPGEEISITFDVSNIRRRGAPLVTSGGIACGPAPLVSMLTDFVRHLNGCIDRALTSLDSMVLDHTIAACVVAGGKRRSSRIAVKNWKDHDIFEFINCKRVDGAHWSTNISVEVDDEFFAAYAEGDKWAKDVMRAVVVGKCNNGEPGFWNRSLAMKGEREPEKMFCPNPCGEIGLQMWENCNLGHINLEAFARQPKQNMMEAFRLMTRWLVRATFGDIPQPRQREVVDRNRRIGVGFFGYHAYIALRGGKYSTSWKDEAVKKTLQQAYETVAKEAASYAGLLGIPVPVKNTTLAPTGTIAILPGTTTSGQAMLAPWYKRLVRYSIDDPELAVKKEEGYETFPDEDAKNTEIVVYWCEDPLVTKVRTAGWNVEEIMEGQADVSFSDCLKVQEMLQTYYADNSISYTINMQVETMPSEEEMEKLLISALPNLKGTTVFPDKSRKNAPFQPLTREEFESYKGRKEITMVEDVCQNGCPVEPSH